MPNRRQDPPSTASGEASGKHQGLRQPAEDGRVEDTLDRIGLDDRGEAMEDQLRDRRGKGTAERADDANDPAAPRH